ncbi:DUF1540 domain-containing protein [Clostridium minihomine]|uniref:DUF1540 domain-containing protein n=1 Tax=Clostridium minihomine TaxID=2045012 RepID=UPI000C7674A0|nr:DUF1540 domain-containing protein [Clostridium minihomine]
MTNSNGRPNPSIGCSVEQCQYHYGAQDFCSLDKIQIGTHEQNPTVNQCTDCQSFQPKQ